ncbi:MAG: hypothetical protein RIS48_1351 [Pseudomonadota bacterium]|jgi:putative transposase
MRISKFSESQIVVILKEGEVGLPVAEVCRKHGISAPTYSAKPRVVQLALLLRPE